MDSSATPEPQPAESNPDRAFQYSLRSLFGLTCGIAAFFSLARTLGYVDAIVILAGIVIVVGVMEYPRRVHLPTGILLTIVTGTLLWANLRTTGWQEICNELPPDYLDPISKAMFYRGWPVSPCMICEHQNLSVRHGGGGAMIFDGVFCTVVLLAMKAACEHYFRRRSWLAWVAYVIVLLGMFTLAIAIDLRINSAMRTPCGPSLMPVYIIFTGVGVFVIGLAFMTITDGGNQKEQRAANTGHTQSPPGADKPRG